MKLALKVDVTTRRGAREGVPRIVDMLNRFEARATFFLALGPDHLFGRGWLPSGDIGRRCAAGLRGLRDAGFEVAIQAHDPARWTKRIAQADASWTLNEMERAASAFLRLFEAPAHAHGATDGQMNRHAWRLIQRFGFRYASDTRGEFPFIPVRNAEVIACPQLPTTLPMLDELMAHEGVGVDACVAKMIEATARPAPAAHVYTLRADREGIRWARAFETLLAGWREQGYTLCALEDCLEDLNPGRLPRHNVTVGNVPGREQPLALQGAEFLA